MAQRGSGRSTNKPASNKSGKPGKSGARPNKQSTAAQRALKDARGGNKLITVVVPIAVVVIIAGAVALGVVLSRPHSGTDTAATSSTSAAPTQQDSSTSVLASTAGQATGQTVDGVESNNMEQVLFHVHAHVALYINGQQKLIPYGIGIVPPYQLQQTSSGPFVAGGTKYYWLHTHDESGVVHIESPVQRTYTLGMFFDIWNQPLSATQIGPYKGAVTAFVDGQKFTGNPRDVPLNAHSVIQLDLGSVVPFSNYTFPQGL